MARSLVQLLLFVCVAANSIFGAQAKSPWLGVWSASLGDYGIIALSIGDKGDGEPSRAEVWWLVDALRPTDLRIEGDTLFIELPDHKRTAVAGLALRLTDKGTLRFSAHGMLPSPLDPLYAAVEFTRPKDDNPWYRITNTSHKTSEWGKWHESGQLKPLPTDWPAAITSPLLRLFAYNDHLFYRVVVLPSLPESDLSDAYAWTHDKNIWSNGPDHIRQRIGQNPSTPTTILAKLWNTPADPRLWIAAAQNPRAPAEWRESLIPRILATPENVRVLATYGGGGPPELYLRLAESTPSLRGQLAGNRDLPISVFEHLASAYPAETIRNLALNTSVPVTLLDQIALGADRKLQIDLINNPAIPPATRVQLVAKITAAATPSDFARFVHDRDAPADFLARCAEDLEPTVRAYAAQNTNAPESLLHLLAEDLSRYVAASARDALQQRFPAAYSKMQGSFTPLDSRVADTPLQQQFETAISTSDLPTLRRLAAYYAPRNQLDAMLGQTARLVIRDGYRPAVLDLFRELGFDSAGGGLADLAGQCGGNPEWMAYFKKYSAFEKPHAARAYHRALESKVPANLAGLISAGIDPNQPDDESLTALHRAVLQNNIAAAEALLKHGANPDLLDRNRRTPLDYAVALKSIAAIRLLDKSGSHATLIADFTKEFPPAPNSPFLGNWTNNRDGFYTVSISLNPDGSGRFGGGVVGGLMAWREMSRTEAVAYLFNERGTVERDFPIKLTLDSTDGILTFAPAKGESQRMIRAGK